MNLDDHNKLWCYSCKGSDCEKAVNDNDDVNNAFFLSNGTGTNNCNWLGTLWVPYGKIKIKSSGIAPTTKIEGAIWCGNTVYIEKNTEIKYAPLIFDPNNINFLKI